MKKNKHILLCVLVLIVIIYIYDNINMANNAIKTFEWAYYCDTCNSSLIDTYITREAYNYLEESFFYKKTETAERKVDLKIKFAINDFANGWVWLNCTSVASPGPSEWNATVSIKLKRHFFDWKIEKIYNPPY